MTVARHSVTSSGQPRNNGFCFEGKQSLGQSHKRQYVKCLHTNLFSCFLYHICIPFVIFHHSVISSSISIFQGFINFSAFNGLLFRSLFSYLSIYLSIYLWLYSTLSGLGRFFNFLIFTQSVGYPEQGTSPTQGCYLYTGQHKHRINAHRHPCLKWNSNPRSQCFSGRRWFMP
jgi:hypothetical protein